MNAALDDVLRHLRALVAFDTRNPPRRIDGSGLFAYVREQLPGFEHSVADHGEGCIALLCTRGATDTVYNFHVDTVPDSPDWSCDPFELHVADGRARALGACDIKGAAACMLAAANATSGPLALLFTSDEEFGDSRCVKRFLSSPHGYAHAIVAEPTGCEAVTAHRGYAGVTARFAGSAGHASEHRALADSAVHRAVRWAHAALAYAEDFEARGAAGLAGLRLNLGRIEGGIKANVIAPGATIRLGLRPPPSYDPRRILDELAALPEAEHARWQPGMIGPPLPAGADGSAERAAERAAALDLPLSEPVDFWTEASLFSAAGLTALVYGPGDIRQAHTADEWVALSELERALHTYRRLIDHGS